MSWHYSQALVEAFSADSCLDGEPSALSSSTNTPEAYYSHDKTTVASSRSQFGMTCERLTADHGAALLTCAQADFRAKTFPRRERVQASAAANPGCGTTWPASFARFSPPLFLPKTAQCSLLGGLMLYSETWPRWGSMRNGACWARTMPELPTKEIGSGYSLPTPTATSYGTNKGGAAGRTGKARPSLQTMARHNTWPTPQANHGTSGIANSGDVLHLRAQVDSGNMDYRDALRVTRGAIHHKNLPPWREAEHQAHIKANGRRYSGPKHGGAGSLAPDWVEWLMGWPIGHTGLEPSETDKCHTAWHWPTGSSSSE